MTIPVTRLEIAECVQEAFDKGSVNRDELIERAVADDARPEVLTVIERLPDDRYCDLRELWKYLDDVPVEIA